MQSMELHNVSSGECIVLRGANKDLLMVDCGEPETGSISDIMKRYAGAVYRDFLLTHYHEAEICSFQKLLKINPNTFNRIFLPASPCDKRGRALLLEFALFTYAFSNKKDDSYLESIFLLRIFSVLLKKSDSRIFALKTGSAFQFDGVDYEVLWPAATDYPFSDLFSAAVEDMNVCLSSPFLPEEAGQFLKLKEQFCAAYLACCGTSPVNPKDISRMNTIFNSIENIMPRLKSLPSAPDIAEILDRPTTREAYKREQQAASIIFQNRRKSEASTDDILMTGSAAPESMDAISDKLYDGYYILKAPQHGAAGAWSHLFNEISASHILISNGNNRKPEPVAGEYLDLPSIKHCTDCSACVWFQNSGYSCNRMNCCYELHEPGLTIKCPYCHSQDEPAPCGIYQINRDAPRSCLCDNKPIYMSKL
ncbi:MAG: MBL fold metallo-hydrolase [Eubacteriales bacterium]|jgi:hypothetical protein